MTEEGLFIELKTRSVALSRGLQRFIQRSVSQWARCQTLWPDPKRIQFEVIFERRKGHQIGCYTRIVSHLGEWFAISCGRSPQEAFRNGLNQLLCY